MKYINLGLLVLYVAGTTLAGVVEDVPLVHKPLGECPKVDGEFPVYLPDSENITIFYQCSNGVPWLQFCPPLTIFNPKESVCVLATPSALGEEENPDVLKEVGVCPPVDGEHPVYLPDDTDPTIFYICSNGKPWKNKCPPKTIFDPLKSVCVKKN